MMTIEAVVPAACLLILGIAASAQSLAPAPLECPCTSWRWDPNERFIDGAIKLDSETGTRTGFTMPMDVKPGQTIHIIAEATDNGTPALTHYERFVVTAGNPSR